jgi:NAD(P)-dependent dehydrogenase (short-subunit alcohol dehydrogenase family)
MRTLSGKVALVTGAGSGIGAATARLFAAHGAKVALLGCWAEEIDAVARDIAAEGGEALSLWANVAIAQDVADAFEKLRNHWGRLDVLFANAGVNGTWAPLEELTEAEWDEPMEVNLRGTFLVTKAALPLLKVRGGSIIVTSSVNGTRMFSMSGATAYACSKAALLTFAKMAAVELARHRIRVNAVCPGFIDSQIHGQTRRRHLDGLHRPVEFPEGPIPLTGHTPGQPEQVAQQVLFFASDAADHITGTEVYIDGAQSLLQG